MSKGGWLVTWEIDIDKEQASTPQEAAQWAYNYMQAPTTATVFSVKDGDIESSEEVVIDLDRIWYGEDDNVCENNEI